MLHMERGCDSSWIGLKDGDLIIKASVAYVPNLDGFVDLESLYGVRCISIVPPPG